MPGLVYKNSTTSMSLVCSGAPRVVQDSPNNTYPKLQDLQVVDPSYKDSLFMTNQRAACQRFSNRCTTSAVWKIT